VCVAGKGDYAGWGKYVCVCVTYGRVHMCVCVAGKVSSVCVHMCVCVYSKDWCDGWGTCICCGCVKQN